MKIVEDSGLNHTSKSSLFYKINTKRIMTKKELEEQLEKTMETEKLIREQDERRRMKEYEKLNKKIQWWYEIREY